jgi:hypothetical protein
LGLAFRAPFLPRRLAVGAIAAALSAAPTAKEPL